MTAIVVSGRHLYRQIDQAEFLVDRNLCPHAGISVRGPRTIKPCVVAKLSRLGNRSESPEELAGAYVEGANQAFGVVVSPRAESIPKRCAHDDFVFRYHRGRMQTYFSLHQIDLVACADLGSYLQVNHSVFSEGGVRNARFRIECNQTIAGGG